MNYCGGLPSPIPRKENDGPVHLKKGLVVGNRWKVMKKIGEGGCGAVYKVEEVTTKVEAALKVESNFVPGGSVLKLEVLILKRLEGRPHVAQLLHSGKRHNYSYMVMTLLGESLNHLIKKCNRMCSVSTQIRVGINVLYGIKQIHDIGFVHRDLKPANLAVGPSETSLSHFVYVLDFGLSREFVVDSRDAGRCMRRPRSRCLFRGTTRYCSVNTHDKGEQSRVDDLWSLVYLMAEMRGPLPWYHCKEKREVAEVKRNTQDKHLLYNSPVQLLEFVQHLRTLQYYSRPDYRLLFNLLTDVMHDGNFKFSDPYDWENKKPKLSREIRSETRRGNAPADSKEAVQPAEEAGSRHSKVDLHQQDTIPAPVPFDPENPFPVEDFEVNPLGF